MATRFADPWRSAAPSPIAASGKLAIRRGQVTFVPIVNMKAYRANTREGDRNLNRNLRERASPSDNEDLVGNALCKLLRAHDVLLDIHSFRSQGEAVRLRRA